MAPATAFPWHVLNARVAMVLGPLVLATLLAVLAWSVLVPALAVPELSPTRWYTLGRQA